MAAPQSIVDVERLAAKLHREGFIGSMVFESGEAVQVRHRHEVFCACVVRRLPGSSDRRPSVMVETIIGTAYVSPENIRRCGAVLDGRCGCAEGARGGRGTSRTGAPSAPPLGNTGITTVAGD